MTFASDGEKDRYPRGGNHPFEEQAFIALDVVPPLLSKKEEKKKNYEGLTVRGMINNSVSRGGIIISQRNGRENRLVILEVESISIEHPAVLTIVRCIFLCV